MYKRQVQGDHRFPLRIQREGEVGQRVLEVRVRPVLGDEHLRACLLYTSRCV